MGAVICVVEPNSPAARAGVHPGEELCKINGVEIRDVLDYKFYSYDTQLTLVLSDRTVTVRKEEGEDLGLTFESYLMDRAKRCSNKCIFCFIDQLPKGMRETLYFKDDDARMSFLMGNYTSLTNLSEADIARIIKMRISPLNISVQATDPDVRVQMVGNPRARDCLSILKRFAQEDLMFNCQIVVCPGVNDGEVLRQSLQDLLALYPAVNSISVVPVGITRYREGLYPLIPVDAQKAAEIIDLVEEFSNRALEQHYTRIVYPSDELFLRAGRPIPEPDYYEEYPQLENGVGMMALLEDEFHAALHRIPRRVRVKNFTLATGVSAAPFLAKLIDELAKKCNNRFRWEVVPVVNRFFGETVNVAGLITGRDLIETLRGRDLGERLFIPEVMLRHASNVFLDDVTLADAEAVLGVPVIPLPNDGATIVTQILS